MKSSVRALLVAISLTLFAGCTKPDSESLPLGKPVFQPFNYETVHDLLISRNEPEHTPWTARFIAEGWLGPQQVTPRWLIKQSPEGLSLTDSLADGGFLRHLLDSLKGLRKVGTTPKGDDAGFGLLPARSRLEWIDGPHRFEILLGSPVDSGGRYARIGNERLIVNGAALDMLDIMQSFQRTRLQKLFTWLLDDADRVRIRWSRPQALWAVERSSGGWIRSNAKNAKTLSDSTDQLLEAVAHLQIEKFDLPGSAFEKPEITIEWLDRANHELKIEIDVNFRARSSDRPGSVFQLYDGARTILARGRYLR